MKRTILAENIPESTLPVSGSLSGTSGVHFMGQYPPQGKI